MSAVALGWLALGGAGNCALRLSSDPLIGAFALLYAIFAGAAAIGLWRLQRSGLTAFRVWCALCVFWLPVFPLRFGSSWSRTVIFAALMGGLLFIWHRYLFRNLRPAAPDQHAAT